MDEWVRGDDRRGGDQPADDRRGDDQPADDRRGDLTVEQAELERELTPYPMGLEEVMRDSRRRQRLGVGLSIVAVVLLLAGVMALRGDRTGAPRLVRDDDAEVADVAVPTTAAGPDVSDATATQSLGLGSPIDGKESLRLPVRVVPDTGLVDGQRVTVKAEGFEPNVRVGVVTCTIAAIDAGVAACDISSNFEYGQTDFSGRVTVTYTFRRFITIGGGRVDCLQGNIDPAEFGDRADRKVVPLVPAGGWTGCLVAVGMLDDYDQSGGWPVLMQGATALPMPAGTTAPSSAPPTTPTTAPGAVPRPGASTTMPVAPPTTVPPTAGGPPTTVPPETFAPPAPKAASTPPPTAAPAPRGTTP